MELALYRPLTTEESINFDVIKNEFYETKRVLNKEIEKYSSRIKKLYRKILSGKSSEISDIIEEIKYAKSMRSIAGKIITDLRPATPQGEIQCHSCDTNGMAYVKHVQPHWMELPVYAEYKCESCGAESIQDEELGHNGFLYNF